MQPRLQNRYAILVPPHVPAAGTRHAGPSAPLAETSAFAATPAAGRFLHNERVTVPLLAEPLQALAQRWRTDNATAWAVVMHDWSALSSAPHTCTTDRKSHASPDSHGYDLGTLLRVDGRNGDPVAPVELELRTAQDIYSTRKEPPRSAESRLDNVLPAMPAVDRLGLGTCVVHMSDREADALAHSRAWQADQRYFLVRADASRCGRWQDAERTRAEIRRRLQAHGHWRRRRDVTYRGQTAVPHVAATTVTLDRPAGRQRCRNGTVCNERVPGEPITLRLMVSRVCNARGETLAVWYLFSNVPAAVAAETRARCSYWRWRIASFCTLLKSAGQAVEQWHQQTGEAIVKRLLVAAMACALVGKVARATTPAAIAFRDFLVRLSGRQLKYATSYTAPALRAGLWVYLAMLEARQHHSSEELQAMKTPRTASNPTPAIPPRPSCVDTYGLQTVPRGPTEGLPSEILSIVVDEDFSGGVLSFFSIDENDPGDYFSQVGRAVPHAPPRRNACRPANACSNPGTPAPRCP